MRGRLVALAAATLVAATATIAILAGTVFGGTVELPGIARDPAPSVTGLRFVDHSDPATPGETDLVPPPGGLTLAYFGFLSCPDICPMTMGDIRRALDEVGPDAADRVAVAFVTVDPERDTGERIRDYLDHFFDGRGVPLTAPDEPSLAAAAERLGVRWEIEDHEPDAERYDVAHTSITYVIDDRGEVVRELPFGVSSDDIAAVIRHLLS